MTLAEKIRETKVPQNEIAIFYLAQAGFCLKTPENKIIVIDAYLSDACERLFGFKRMIPALIKAEELNADLFASTHSHADHLDPDTVPRVAESKKTIFLGAPDCEELYQANNIGNYQIIKEDEEKHLAGISIRAIYADHGDLAPDAVGFLLNINGIKIYHVSDTCLQPEKIARSLHSEVDVMMVPINGTYGNMDAVEACQLVKMINPKIVIPIHFWMFLQHVSPDGTGDPLTFLQEMENLPKSVKPLVMAPGELLKYTKN